MPVSLYLPAGYQEKMHRAPRYSGLDFLRDIPGSTSFVPPAAGAIAASEVIRGLTCFDPSSRVKGGKGTKA